MRTYGKTAVITVHTNKNGVVEWVFPVLDGIYSQNCDDDQFEAVVTDDGD